MGLPQDNQVPEHAGGALLVIAGPTAAGKTEAAIRVAESVPAEIVSADSMQIYRELEAGTAKPTPGERARAVFHLTDCVDPRLPYTVADYQREARERIAEVQARGRLPILCGGTGLYIRAVLGGLSFPPGATEQLAAIRSRLEEEAAREGSAALHRRLLAVDAATAARLAPADRKRIIRALEVYEHTGQPFSRLARVDGAAKLHYNSATFGLTCPRAVLYERINSRVDAMLAAGWLAEVGRLRQSGLGHAHQAMQAIGYRHLLNYLEEDGQFEAVVENIKRDTRRFAKRQLTWFRREAVQWLEWEGVTEFAVAVSTLTRAARSLMQCC